MLCLCVSVFAFSSCGKKKSPVSSTADAGGGTTAAPTTEAAPTAPAHVHVPDKDYTILANPTCSTTGEKCLYCAECGEKIPDSTVEIPIDPSAHRFGEMTGVKPTLLDPVGWSEGVCLICEETIHADLEWTLQVYASSSLSGDYTDGSNVILSKSAGDIRGEKQFYPTEADPDGNDLWFEYSILWNSTLKNYDSAKFIKLVSFRNGGFKDFYILYTKDDQDGDCPFAGHIDYTTYLPKCDPNWSCAVELGNGVPLYKGGWVRPVTRDASPCLWDKENQTQAGWHRIGFHFHEDATIDDGKVLYTGFSELFIDGVKVWKVLTNMQGAPDGSDIDRGLQTNNLLLFTAAIDPNDPKELVYTPNDTLQIQMRIEGFAYSSTAYAAFDDPLWTCGDGFVRNVEPSDDLAPETIVFAEGVEEPIAVFYRNAAD